MRSTDDLLMLALQEDIGHGDVTTLSTVSPDLSGAAVVFGREPFVLSGSESFCRVFELLDHGVQVQRMVKDGDEVGPDDAVFRIRGSYRTLLTGERTALNLLQRMCGIATLTRSMVRAIAGSTCKLLDTRKTTPLWRSLEKSAVRDGGGFNHRFGLSDGILIKDNHIAAVGGVAKAVEAARQHASHMLRVEVEVDSIEQMREALDARADIILLDNFTLDRLREAVSLNAGRALLEASGGVTMQSVAAIAATGIDFISCGALTHSARAIDLTMEISS